MAKKDLNGRGFNDWNKNVDNFDYNKRANEIDGEYIKPKEKGKNEPNFSESNNKIDENSNVANKVVSEQNLNQATLNVGEQNGQEPESDNYKKSKYEEIAEQIISDIQNKNDATSDIMPTKKLGEDVMKQRKTDFPMLIAIFVSHCVLFGLAIMLFFIKLNASATGKALISNFLSIFLVLIYSALFIVELFLMLRCQKRAGKMLFFVSMALIFPTVGILIP